MNDQLYGLGFHCGLLNSDFLLSMNETEHDNQGINKKSVCKYFNIVLTTFQGTWCRKQDFVFSFDRPQGVILHNLSSSSRCPAIL